MARSIICNSWRFLQIRAYNANGAIEGYHEQHHDAAVVRTGNFKIMLRTMMMSIVMGIIRIISATAKSSRVITATRTTATAASTATPTTATATAAAIPCEL